MFWHDDGDARVKVEIKVASLGVGHGGIGGNVDSCRRDVIVVVITPWVRSQHN